MTHTNLEKTARLQVCCMHDIDGCSHHAWRELHETSQLTSPAKQVEIGHPAGTEPRSHGSNSGSMRILGVPQLVPSQYSCCHLIALELSLNEVCYRLAHNGPRTRNESNSFAIALHAMFRRFISSSLALLFFNSAHRSKGDFSLASALYAICRWMAATVAGGGAAPSVPKPCDDLLL